MICFFNSDSLIGAGVGVGVSTDAVGVSFIELCNLLNVSGPTIPSTPIPLTRWNSVTAAFVNGPYFSSGTPLS